jgi:serine/threonine protein kinase
VGLTDPFGIIGQKVDGQYLVEELVGEGGLTLVYKGRSEALDAAVAIKCLNLPATLDPALLGSLVKNFHEASQVHYRLSQGNLHIARSIGSGTTRSPTLGIDIPYLVREWLVGHSLATDFAKRRAQGLTGRRLPEVLTLFDSAANALGYAHSRGLVHHHVNPGNLFLAMNAEGTTLRVLDFGVAKVVRDHVTAVQGAETSGQLQIFYPAYAAPEQLDKSLGAVGPWTDVCALALVILEALRDAPVVSKRVATESWERALDPTQRPTPRSLGITLPEAVDAILTRAVSLDPTKRPRDALAFWTALKDASRRATEGRLRNPAAPVSVLEKAPPSKNAVPTLTPGFPGFEDTRRSARPAPTQPKPVVPPTRSPTLMMFGAAGPAPVLPEPALPNLATDEERGSQSTIRISPEWIPPPEASGKARAVDPPLPPPAPVEAAHEEAGPATHGSRRRIAGGLAGVLVAALAGVALYRCVHASPEATRPAPIPSTAEAPATSAVALAAPPTSAPPVSPVPPPDAIDPPPAPTPARAAPAPRSQTVPPAKPPRAAPSNPNGFKRTAAIASLNALSRILAGCSRPGGRTGQGNVLVTFGNDGSVSRVRIDPPFAGTSEGTCIVGRFGAAHVPPYQGAPETVRYAFRLSK